MKLHPFNQKDSVILIVTDSMTFLDGNHSFASSMALLSFIHWFHSDSFSPSFKAMDQLKVTMRQNLIKHQ